MAGGAELAWSTRGSYKGDIEWTILPTLGQRPLRRLDTATLDRFYSELRGRGGVGGRPMAPATVRQVHAILRRGWIRRPAGAGFGPTQPPGQPTPARVGRDPPAHPAEVSRLLETAYEADPDFAVLLWPRRPVPGAGAVRAGVGEW